ncbi:MAG: DNA sulfur modification protein DndB [Candidatus Acidiferrales bacterium]
MKTIDANGFVAKPRKTAGGQLYRGRFTCNDVQWTGEGEELLATFTLTAEEIAAAAENQLVWTDQDVQRGIRPEVSAAPARELPVGEGYPDPKLYIFDAANADDIAEKLLRGDKLFLSPLVWNLRPGAFEAYWDDQTCSIYLYSGRIYLPDSHHRQQAILKAIRCYRDSPSSYPKFSPSRQFKLELYFLTKQDEGNYFFDKNQRPQPTAKSKAYDLTTLDDLSMLAKKVIEKSTALKNNVNRVTDRLTAKNSQVVTLSTLREMMKSISPADSIDELEIDGLATLAATFYDLLAEARPELGRLEQGARKAVRERLVVDAAVMMHGYASLIVEFNDAIGAAGVHAAKSEWQTKLQRLAASQQYSLGNWHGDFFEKRNPLWQRVGVVKPGRDGKRLTVLNTGAARSECGRVLRRLLSADKPISNLTFLTKR